MQCERSILKLKLKIRQTCKQIMINLLLPDCSSVTDLQMNLQWSHIIKTSINFVDPVSRRILSKLFQFK